MTGGKLIHCQKVLKWYTFTLSFTMHEVSIIKNSLEIVEQAAINDGIKYITEIKLVIGEKRVVLPEALYFGFEAFTKDSDMFENCKLTIETRDILLHCKDCRNKYNADLSVSICDNCQSSNTELLEGNELYVDYFEGGGDRQ